MAAVSATRKNGLLLIFLLFVQLVLMSASVKGSAGVSRLESALVWATSPVVHVSGWIGATVSGVWRGGGQLIAAHRRNARLETELNRLRSELRDYREAGRENARLRELLSMRDRTAVPAVGASVVTAVSSGGERVLVIDRGRGDGLVPDLPVVARGAAVGRLIAVFDDYAKVLLLTDSDSGVGGLVQRSRAQGVVLGKGAELFELQYVPRFSDVAEGDHVVTSALDGIFPRGFGIGSVIAIDERADGTKTVFVKPELDYDTLEEVLVLLEAAGGGVVEPPEVVSRQ